MTPASGARYRLATVEDAAAIADVHVASWRWAYEGQLPDAVLAALSVEERTGGWVAVLAEVDAARGGVDVAVDDEERVTGFASVGPTRDEDADEGTGELFAVYVRPEVAGTGVGPTLLARAQGRLRDAGFHRATLWVLETNVRARRFYERHGWVWDGTRSTHRFDCDERPIVRYALELDDGR